MYRRPLLPLFLTALSLPALNSCHISNRGVDFSPLTDRLESAVDDDVLLEGESAGNPTPVATPTNLVFNDTAPAPAPTSAAEAPIPAPAPAPAAAPAPAPAATGGTYVVKAGDTLSGIASRHHTTYAQLAAVNGIAPTSTLHIGQTLRLPSGGSTAAVAAKPAAKAAAKPAKAAKVVKGKGRAYTVQSGDTLYAIARKNGISPAALMQANGLTPATAGKLSIGTTLTIPAK